MANIIELKDKNDIKSYPITKAQAVYDTDGDTVSEKLSTDKADIASLKQQFNSLASLPEGSTRGDAELINIRTTWYGTTESNAGGAVRDQTQNLILTQNSQPVGNAFKANKLWVKPSQQDIEIPDMDDIAKMNQRLDDDDILINIANNKIKSVPFSGEREIDNLSIKYSYGKIVLNGNTNKRAIVIEADLDATTITKERIPCRQGISTGLIADNAAARKVPIEPGQYRFVFNLLSGTVTKNGVTYTSDTISTSANVVNAFLFYANIEPNTSHERIAKTNTTTQITIEDTQIGLQALYCYQNCSFDNAIFELYVEKVIEEEQQIQIEIDDTLSISGKAADAKVAGDTIKGVKENLDSSNVLINIANNRVKSIPFNGERTVDGLSIKYSYGKIILNGSTEQHAIVIEADLDTVTITRSNIPCREGLSEGFYADNAAARKVPIEPGRYRFVFNMLSGSVTKNGITYTSNTDFTNANVVNAFLFYADADYTITDHRDIVKTHVPTQITIEDTQIGLQALYCYINCYFDNAVFELYLEKIEDKIVDNTLTLQGKAADAKVTGDMIRDTQKTIDENNALTSIANNKIKNVPSGGEREVDGLSIKYSYGRIILNGNTDAHATVIEADLDCGSEFRNDIKCRQGLNDGIIADNTAARKLPIEPGRYRFVFNMLSGTVTRNGITYTSNADFGSTNVVNAYLLYADAYLNPDGHRNIAKASITKQITIEDTQVGLQVLYCYQYCSFDNAVFELYVEKIADQENGIPYYWNEEIDKSIAQIQSNAISASHLESTTICFITDCHWKYNQKHSPAIVKKIFENCNIHYFINGGDLIYRHNGGENGKEQVEKELMDCINAFKICGKPMITVYGNHDRNRNANTDHPETYLTAAEHANIVFKSFWPSPDIKHPSGDTFYWDDDIYRYVCLYWYYSANARSIPWASEVFNTTKPVVIFCHGIYFGIYENPEEDVIDNGWILQSLEPYKDQIKCFIQGHTHRDGLRHAWGTVPIIIIDCDTAVNNYATVGTSTEQSFAVITLDTDKISVVKVGRGEDFEVTADSPDWRQEYITTSP